MISFKKITSNAISSYYLGKSEAFHGLLYFISLLIKVGLEMSLSLCISIQSLFIGWPRYRPSSRQVFDIHASRFFINIKKAICAQIRRSQRPSWFDGRTSVFRELPMSLDEKSCMIFFHFFNANYTPVMAVTTLESSTKVSQRSKSSSKSSMHEISCNEGSKYYQC